MIPYTDLFFADLKIADSEKHRKFTGQDNALIISNIKRLSEQKTQIILRIPLIPNVNDSEQDINAFAKIINSFETGIQEVELLRYNHLAKSKYAIAGRTYTEFSPKPQTDADMQKIQELLSAQCSKKCYFVPSQSNAKN